MPTGPNPSDPEPLADVSLIADDGDWTLVFIRDLRHPPEAVWVALTEPDEIDQWAPYAADRDLGATGPARLVMIDGANRTDLAATVHVAEKPRLLEYTWGDDRLRWELEPIAGGTRLVLRHTLAMPDMDAMVAAGWHLCVVVLDRLLDGHPIGVIRGRDAMAHGWAQLRDRSAAKLRDQTSPDGVSHDGEQEPAQDGRQAEARRRPLVSGS